jgi:hypothetical protein
MLSKQLLQHESFLSHWRFRPEQTCAPFCLEFMFHWRVCYFGYVMFRDVWNSSGESPFLRVYVCGIPVSIPWLYAGKVYALLAIFSEPVMAFSYVYPLWLLSTLRLESCLRYFSITGFPIGMLVNSAPISISCCVDTYARLDFVETAMLITYHSVCDFGHAPHVILCNWYLIHFSYFWFYIILLMFYVLLLPVTGCIFLCT